MRVLDRKPGKDVWVAEADAGTFLGDIATFTGEPAIAECVADEPTDVIVFERSELRAMLAAWPELAELVLRTMMARRQWHEANGHGVARLIAPRGSRRAFEVRDLLERNLIPVRWYDVDTDDESAAMLDWLQIPREETPVLVRNRSVLRNPSAAQVARELGLRAEIDGERFDLVVLGGGPAGLAAAVYGGSEGLRTLVTEAWAPGGQAGTSTRIENYLGFPTGITGTELTRKATLQARRFDAVLSSFHRAVELARGDEGLIRVDLDDGQHALARTVVVATGARWRELAADNVARFTGAGVYHAAMASDAERCRGEDVIVVGGGNSAGQAAVHLSGAARSVRIVIRGDGLAATMSRYLVARIEARPNIEITTQTEVSAFHGDGRLEHADLRNRADGKRRARRGLGRLRDDRRRPVHRGGRHDARPRPGGLHPVRRRGGGQRRTEPLARERPPAAPARDRPARRLRRGRRPRRRDEARLGRGRRRRPGRALRPPGAAGLSPDADIASALASDRLRLREFRDDDLDVLAAMVGDDEQMTFYPRPKTRDEAAAWIRLNRELYATRGFGTWLIEVLPHARFAGYCGIRPLELERVSGDRDRLARPQALLEAGHRHRGSHARLPGGGDALRPLAPRRPGPSRPHRLASSRGERRHALRTDDGARGRLSGHRLRRRASRVTRW